MRRGKLPAAITQLISKCPLNEWKWWRRVKEAVSFFPCCPVNREYSWNKIQIEKKTEKVNSSSQHVRTNFCSMMGEKRLRDDTYMTSMIIVNFHDSLNFHDVHGQGSCPFTSPILPTPWPWTSNYKRVSLNDTVHVNERNHNENKIKSRHIQIDHVFYCSNKTMQ